MKHLGDRLADDPALAGLCITSAILDPGFIPGRGIRDRNACLPAGRHVVKPTPPQADPPTADNARLSRPPHAVDFDGLVHVAGTWGYAEGEGWSNADSWVAGTSFEQDSGTGKGWVGAGSDVAGAKV